MTAGTALAFIFTGLIALVAMVGGMSVAADTRSAMTALLAGSAGLALVARVRRGLVCGGAAVGVCLLLAGCAGPVPDYGAYRHAALNTAMAMVSSLAAAQLAVQDDLRGRRPACVHRSERDQCRK